MRADAASREGFAPAVLIVGAITAARVAALALDRTDLFVDEAQYWLWGQHLDFGYYSKPPLIAWTIRAVTELAGSNAAFWVRLPGALCHGVAALLMGMTARDMAGARAGAWTAVAYATLPMAALGSLLFSTDTLMAPFYALALWAWLRLARGGRMADAAVCGAAVGAAMMAKYAGGYFLICAGLAALAVPQMRVGWSRAAVVVAVAAAVVAPNVWWNLTHGMTTISHTADNVQWVRGDGPALHPGEAARFVAAQFAVFGPVLFGALLMAAVRPCGNVRRGLLWMSLPIVAAVTVQAGLSRAYANWAVAAYFAGTVAVVPWLAARHVGWLRASMVVNGAVCVALPLLAIFPTALTGADGPLLKRYLGRADLSRAVIDAARREGVAAIVAGHRDLLADLFHTGRDAGIVLRAVPVGGRAPHYYAQAFPLTDAVAGPVLWLARPTEVACDGAPLAPVARFDTAGGAYAGRDLVAYVVPQKCRDVLDPAR